MWGWKEGVAWQKALRQRLAHARALLADWKLCFTFDAWCAFTLCGTGASSSLMLLPICSGCTMERGDKKWHNIWNLPACTGLASAWPMSDIAPGCVWACKKGGVGAVTSWGFHD